MVIIQRWRRGQHQESIRSCHLSVANIQNRLKANSFQNFHRAFFRKQCFKEDEEKKSIKSAFENLLSQPKQLLAHLELCLKVKRKKNQQIFNENLDSVSKYNVFKNVLNNVNYKLIFYSSQHWNWNGCTFENEANIVLLEYCNVKCLFT